MPIDVLFLVLPDTLLLDLAGPAEAFRLANQALQRRGQPPAFRLRYTGPEPQTTSSVGLALCGLEPLPTGFEHPTWTVLLGRPGDSAQVIRRQRAWLQARQWLAQVLAPALASASGSAPALAAAPPHAKSAKASPPAASSPGPHRLLTVCVGALLAADAGLLAHRACTTHHELLDDLARIAPSAQVLADRLWVEDGAVCSSAGITAGIDLALHLVAQACGPALAATVAQVMVAPGRRGPAGPQQHPLLAYRDHLHPAVHRVQEAVAERPGNDWSAAALAAVAHVTPRHLLRLFQRHTGLAPSDYVRHVRSQLAQAARQQGASAAQAAEAGGFRSDRQWRRVRRRLVAGEAA